MVQPRLKIQEKPIELHQDAPRFRNVIELIFDSVPIFGGIDSIECPTLASIATVSNSVNELSTTVPHGGAIAITQCTAFAAAYARSPFLPQL
ncbi:MAG: hypothetical protein AAFY26_15050 [Cyanobacteria bacterium J06638_22]